jgi:hypothetical protein
MNPGIAGGVSGARRLTFYAGIVHSSWLYGMSNQHSSCDLRTSVHRTDIQLLTLRVSCRSLSCTTAVCWYVLSHMKAVKLAAWGYEDCRRHFNTMSLRCYSCFNLMPFRKSGRVGSVNDLAYMIDRNQSLRAHTGVIT